MQLKHLAKALNISPSMCSRLVKRGMPSDSLERALRWRKRHLELARTKGARMAAPQARPQAPSDAGEGSAATDDEPLGDEASAEYREARARRERLRVEREQLELDRERGRLVDADQAANAAFTSFRQVRDLFENIAPRLSTQVHSIAVAGGSVDDVERVIAASVREALEHSAAAVRRLGAGDDVDE
jgi:hypothetical protein